MSRGSRTLVDGLIEAVGSENVAVAKAMFLMSKLFHQFGVTVSIGNLLPQF